MTDHSDWRRNDPVRGYDRPSPAGEGSTGILFAVVAAVVLVVLAAWYWGSPDQGEVGVVPAPAGEMPLGDVPVPGVLPAPQAQPEGAAPAPGILPGTQPQGAAPGAGSEPVPGADPAPVLPPATGDAGPGTAAPGAVPAQ